MITAIIWAAACGMFTVFVIWIYRQGKQNERYKTMAEGVKRAQESNAAEYRINRIPESDLDDELREFTRD